MTAGENTPGFIIPDVGEKSRFHVDTFDSTILYDNSMTSNQKIVYFYYCQHDQISETAEQVASFLYLGVSTVKEAWRRLEEDGYLKLIEKKGRVRTYVAIFKCGLW